MSVVPRFSLLVLMKNAMTKNSMHITLASFWIISLVLTLRNGMLVKLRMGSCPFKMH